MKPLFSTIRWWLIAQILKRPWISRLAHKHLPRKRIAAGILFFDQSGRLLVLKPSYRDCLLLPGGSVERDEPPWAAALREAEEEIGLKLEPGDIELVAVDWQPADVDYDESMHFIFNGGVLSKNRIDAIRVDGAEIVGFEFVDAKIACESLEKGLAVRTRTCLAHQEKGLLVLTGGELCSDPVLRTKAL